MRPAKLFPAILGSACTVLVGTYVTAQVPKEEVRKAERLPQVKAPAVRLEMMKAAVPAANVVQGVVARPIPAQTKEAQIQQLAQRLRPLLRVEYHFLRAVCELNQEQRRQVARAGERGLKEAAARNLGVINNGVQVFVAGQAVPPEARVNDPRKHIQEVLAKALKEVSSKEADQYARELQRREEHTKLVAIRNIVARLDKELLLTSDQRDAIAESLSSGWNDSWGLSVQALVNIDHYFPAIPDSYIVPSLNSVQKDAWRNSQATRQVIRFGVALGADDGIEDEELTEAREAEANEKATP